MTEQIFAESERRRRERVFIPVERLSRSPRRVRLSPMCQCHRCEEERAKAAGSLPSGQP